MMPSRVVKPVSDSLSPDNPRWHHSSQEQKLLCCFRSTLPSEGRKKKKDSEKLYANIAHMVRTKDHSETNLTSNTESDTDQENEVLSFLYHFIKLKAYSIEMIEK